LIADQTNSMSKAKYYFAAATAVIFVTSAILCSLTALHYAGAWLNPPSEGRTSATPSPQIAIPAVAPPPPVTDSGLGGRFIGTWTGHWDGKLAARFTISRKSGNQLTAVYQFENSPGQPMSKKILHPWANDKVLHMPRAAVILTMSDTLANTAQGVVTLTAADNTTTVRTATFVRGGDLQVANWLPANSSAPTSIQPIVLDIKATIDGSDVLNLSPNGAVWSHQAYQWPTDISVNGIAWDAHTQSTLTNTGLAGIDLTTANVLSRSGRDRVDMETTPDGLTIHFDDSPPGAAPYEIKIGFDRK
jgi:hypothetical protein